MLRPLHYALLAVFCTVSYFLARTSQENRPTPQLLPIEVLNNYKLADWRTGFESKLTVESSLPYKEYTGPIEKSGNDQRQYRLIRLPNNLTALCVQDLDAKEAAASLSVNVGSNANPAEFPGLAHFLEHMLFLGTEKYPKEGEYQAYLSRNSGSYNAYTYFYETDYFFSVFNDALEGALDRLSQFFISPLFNADCVDRELKAVDSEHKGNLQSDLHRFYHLMSSVSNPKHPYSWFSTGNTETLKGTAEELGLDLREELIKFYHNYYSADIMHLVVVGNHSLDVLSEWVTSKFSDIESKGNTRPVVDFHPIGKAELGKVIHYKTVREKYELKLQFALPELKSVNSAKPFAYINALLGHKEPGSIYSVLRENGWATDISGYSSSTFYDGFSTYDISVTATPEGLENYEAVVSVIFGYIKMLVESGPQEWYFKELSLVSKARFAFKDKEDAMSYALGLSGEGRNQYVPPQHILSQNYLSRGYDADIISKCLSYLNPSNYRLFIGAQEHKAVECKLEEKYYGVLYNVAELPSHMTSNVKCSPSIAKMLHLPGRNIYLPDSLSVTKPATIADPPALEPVLLRKNDKIEVWFKQDDQFFTPHGRIGLAISSEYVDNSPLNHLLSTLLCKIISAELQEQLFSASMASSYFNMNPRGGRINVGVSGLSNGLPNLLKTALRKIKTFKVDTQQFSIYLAEVERMIQNRRQNGPTSQLFRQLDNLNMVPAFDQDMLEGALKDITLDGLQKHIVLLFSKAYVKMLVSGNYNQSVALDTSNQLRTSEQLGYRVWAGSDSYKEGRDMLLFALEGESNPIYVTQRINEFIRQYRQKLQDLTADEFESSIQSLISLKQEKLKSINEEFGELWTHIKSGKYSFDKENKDVEHLKQLRKDDLLAFWDKYVNKDTAQGYTRLDMQMSSAKIWQPTAKEFEMYPGTILALYGSLRTEGYTGLSIADVQSFVSSADASSTIESLLAELSALYVTKQTPSVSNETAEALDTTVVNVEAPGIVFESLSKIASALQMAISSADEAPKYATLSKTNFANIDMKQSPEGIWLINDYKRFQHTQALHGISVPSRKLVPLITDSDQADNN
ncbi:metalloprotease [Coemansia sp. S3946]|nr:metalloprotease [Coemansia sp. S3946]